MRSVLLLVLAAALAACIDEADPTPYSLRPTSSDADSLLARLDAHALDEAFARLENAGYTARVLVRDGSTGEATSGDTLFAETVEVDGGGARTSGSGTSDARPFRVFDPVARLLPDEPPFRNPSTRGLYRLERRAFADSTVASVIATLGDGSNPIGLAAVAVDTTSGQVVEAQVVRSSESAVYDESGNAYVRLRVRDGAWWPSEGELLSDTDVPLSEGRRVLVEWRVLTVGGEPLGAPSPFRTP